MKRCNNCFENIDDAESRCPHCGYSEGDKPGELFYLAPGTVLADRYIIGKGIGCGGFGITYLAWDKKLEITVAVKEFYPGGLVNRIPGNQELILLSEKQRRQFDVAFARFIEEAQSMAQFSSHNAIVNVFEYFEANRTAYIVMEYLEGIDLAYYMGQNHGKCSYSDTIKIAEKLFDAVEAIHNNGIIHRDIAPDNIMIKTPEQVKLFDFGAAKFADSNSEELMVIVKPGFSPVEQYNKLEKQGPWTDVYALGAVLYYMLTGVKPDESTNRKKQLEESSYQTDTLTEPCVLDPEIPVQQSNAVMKAMAVVPAFRFQSVTDFRRAFLGDKVVLPPIAERKRRKKRRSISMGIASLTAAAVLGVFGVQALRSYVPSSELTLWYELSGNAETDMAKKQGISEVIEVFSSSYPNVSVSAEGFDKSEYREKVAQAIEEGNAPDIFESTGLEGNILSGCISVKNISADSEFVQEFKDKEAYRMPVGWKAFILYQNITLSEPIAENSLIKEITKDSVSYMSGTKSLEAKAENIGISEEYDEIVPDTGIPVIDGESFTDRTYTWYLGTTEDYFDIMDAVTGQVQCFALDENENMPCYYWSALDQGYEKNQGEKAFLKILLSAQGQELLMVKNRSTALPLEEGAWENYCEVYSGAFSALSEENGNE
ncbi:MAG: protein kinase [Ruminococcus sp.]